MGCLAHHIQSKFSCTDRKSYKLHRWTRASLFFLMIFASGTYHTCNSFNACIFQPRIHRKVDFFFAQLLIPVTALYLVFFGLEYAFVERFLIIGFAASIAIVEFLLDEPFVLQLAIAGISLLIILIYWAVYASMKHNEWEKEHGEDGLTLCRGAKLPPYNWHELSVGIALTAFACSLFTVQKSWWSGYVWIHTIWHVLAGFAQYFILCCRDGMPKQAAIDAEVGKVVGKLISDAYEDSWDMEKQQIPNQKKRKIHVGR